MRVVKSMEEKYLLPSLELVEAVFTAHENAEEGKLVRSLVEEIRGMQLDHQSAAARAVKAGFDGVELHCTHGKLFGRFFDSVTNTRTDEYGGSFENRARIYTETLALMREVTPDGFLLGLRIGVNLPDLDNAMGVVKAIDAAGPD